MATNTYVAIETQTVTSTVASVTLGSGGTIPQTYTDLVLVVSGKSTSGIVNWGLRFNGDTGSNYSRTLMFGSSSQANGSRQTSSTSANPGFLTTNGSPTIIQIMNYKNTNTYKSYIARAGDSSDSTSASVGLWRGSTGSATNQPITSITLFSDGSTSIAAGTTFTLYGIANSNVVTPKAFGGIVTQDATYTYHTFGASGTFTPQQSLTADVLVVAGGGGGGSRRGGGGGAGGLLGFASQSLTATGYTVTVGSGGAGGNGGAGTASNGALGGDSQFGALTLVKGGGGATGDGNGTVSTINGGSGGGSTGAYSGGTATSGQGNTGSAGSGSAPNYGAGGGGGAGSVGTAGTSTTGGNGGNGLSTYSSWGVVTGTGQNVSGTIYYAGGGGGAVYDTGGTVGVAGFGGGGLAGAGGGNNAGANGLTNTGGGGGGSSILSSGTAAAGAGGSGIVIIRYAN